MKKLAPLFVLLIFIFPVLAFAGAVSNSKWMNDVPFAFIENKGQFTDDKGKPVPHVLFRASAPATDIYITTSGISYVFVKAEEDEEEEHKAGYREKMKIEWSRVDMDIRGAVIKKENISALEQEEVYYNYYAPHCPDGILQVRSYRKIIVKNVYPGIDWVLYRGSGVKGRGTGAIKYDFIVHPGADPRLIKLEYKGARKGKQLKPTSLQFNSEYGKIVEGELLCHQGGEQVPAVYNLQGSEVSYVLGTYDKSRDLVIDPPLAWATYYGGGMLDGPRGVAIDNAGNLLVAGYSSSANLPTVNPGGGAYFQGVSGGASNAVVMKFSNTGVAQWVTYYSGSNGEWAWDIACDLNSNILVTGRTQSNNFPTFNPGGGAFFQNTMNGLYDGFILKFNPAGVRTWATIYGGNSADESFAIAADPAGNFAVVGCSQSTNLSLFNPGGGAYFQALNAGIYDLFILKFNPACNMVWGTNFGGNSQDFFPVADAGVPMDLCYDLSGNLFITGQTLSTNFPTLNPGGGAYYQAALAGGFDAFILKFNPACILQWSTYYGNGTGDDIGFVVKADKNGNIFVTGMTRSSTFPTLNPGGGAFFQGAYGGGIADAFVMKFTNGGVRLWATYYGGSARDIGLGGDINACDHFYVTGCSASSNLATVNPGGGSFFDNTYGGAGGFGIGDMFILQFGTNCGMIWGTYLGGTADEWGEDLALDPVGNLFVGGEYHLNSTGQPLINPGGGAYYQSTGGGSDDGAYLKFTKPITMGAVMNVLATLCTGTSTGTGTVTASNGTSPYTYSWNTGQSSQTATGLSAGNYTVTIVDASCNFLTMSVNIPDAIALTATVSMTAASCGQSSGSASVSANGGTGSFTYFYSWSPTGQSTSAATGLSAGVYTVTVTDSNGCTNTQSVAITNSGGPSAVVTASGNPNCFGQSTGTATLSSSGGLSPYTYSWSGNSSTTATATGLSAGTYTITVTDANGCTGTQTISLSQPSSINLQTSSISANCNQSNGIAGVTAGGGTGAFTYSWNPGGQTNAAATGLSAGSYTITVTDNNGCTKTVAVAVGSSSGGSVNITASTNVNCFGSSNGSATSSISGGTSPYTYSWNNGQTTASATGLSSGIYTIAITDSSGCTSTQTVAITQPAAVTATAAATAASCNATDGTASVTAGGGTAAYTYSWSGAQTTATATGLSAGSYTVLITDNNGCTQTALANVGQNGGPTANAGVNVTIQQGQSTVLGAVGGTSYTWSPTTGLSCTNCQNPTASPAITTIYCVVVSDNNGCTATACVTVFVEIPCPLSDDFAVPNAFSPNGDGHNDIFLLQGWKDCISEFSLTIYDRWGERVYESSDPDKGWDGTFNGKLMEAAVFAYYISATNTKGEPFIKKGNVSLLR